VGQSTEMLTLQNLREVGWPCRLDHFCKASSTRITFFSSPGQTGKARGTFSMSLVQELHPENKNIINARIWDNCE